MKKVFLFLCFLPTVIFGQQKSQEESTQAIKKQLLKEVEDYFKSDAFDEQYATVYNKLNKTSKAEADSLARKVMRKFYRYAADHVFNMDEDEREKFLKDMGSSEKEIYKVMQDIMRRDPEIRNQVTQHLKSLNAEN
jgi:hypothetical protein